MTKKKSHKRQWIMVLVVLVLIIGLFFILGSMRSKDAGYTKEVSKRQNITTYYSFSGNVAPNETKTQLAKDAMKVKEMFVEEGDTVTAGETLFRTSDGERIRAAIDGEIDELYAEQDMTLAAGASIAKIINYHDLRVDVDVDEYDIGALAVGDEVDIYINALDTKVQGKVTRLNSAANIGNDITYYTAEISVQPDERLRSGMSVEAQVIKDHVENVITVSMKALQFDNENKPFVYVRNSAGEVAAEYVEVGVNDGTTVQILSGISEGTEVYVPIDLSMMMPMAMMRDKT